MQIKTSINDRIFALLTGNDISIEFSLKENLSNEPIDVVFEKIKQTNNNCKIECTDMTEFPEFITISGQKAILQHEVNVISNYTLYFPLNKQVLIVQAVTEKNGFAFNGDTSADWKKYPTQNTKQQFLDIVKTIHLEK
jgi:hypothetical protein